MTSKKVEPSKDYYYNGKTYTKEGLKRQLIKDGIISTAVQTNYFIEDDRYQFDEWGYVNDFDLLLDHLQNCDLVEDPENHYGSCGGQYPYPEYIKDTCDECPYKEDCKKG